MGEYTIANVTFHKDFTANITVMTMIKIHDIGNSVGIDTETDKQLR